jgi:transcriptional regulator with XRE-family HTH domain
MSIRTVSGRFSDISNRLRVLRHCLGMSSKEFAEAADVSPKSYSQWESGDFRLSIDGAIKLNARYGISLDYLFLGNLDGVPHKLAQELQSTCALLAQKK